MSPDRKFSEPRLARILDALDGDRPDLDLYVALAVSLPARSVLDVGCGTGVLARRLARLGIGVVGLDPAPASIEVARAQPSDVTWIVGDARALPPLQVDLAVMTGNVAQVFLLDADWERTLASSRAALRPGGMLAFETRDPAREAWRTWTRDGTFRRTFAPGVGEVEHWCEVLSAEPPFVRFRWTYVFVATGEQLVSDSVLRFRTQDEIAGSPVRAGLVLDEVRDAPDRPGLEFVFIARRAE